MKILPLTLWVSLKERPMIGAISGLCSSMMSACYRLITDDELLKLLSALGIWLGIAIAALTLVIKMIDVYDRLKHKSLNK